MKVLLRVPLKQDQLLTLACITTELDKTKVENMVRIYMENERAM